MLSTHSQENLRASVQLRQPLSQQDDFRYHCGILGAVSENTVVVSQRVGGNKNKNKPEKRVNKVESSCDMEMFDSISAGKCIFVMSQDGFPQNTSCDLQKNYLVDPLRRGNPITHLRTLIPLVSFLILLF